MSKRKIDFREYAGHIIKSLRSGILITTKVGDKVNPMTIGWGTLGVIWERPVFVAYVRGRRFTRELLDKNPEFTVNVPIEGYDRKAFVICGSKSGRDMDKISEAGLTLEAPEVISVPGIREYPLTLECRVIYRQEQELAKIPEDIQRRFYSIENDDHIAYYGEIVAAYVIE